ncbi:MAG: tetratricopeptide repeat protein [Pseudobacter sp.]|uniref:tetratricopeptide repeat protein n=1 Tax=Pseudobacter sp. TaxID=2045420 RepID=UPI003F81D397
MFKPFRLTLMAACTIFAIPAFACLNEYIRTEPPLRAGQLQLKYLLHMQDTARPYWSHGFHDQESRYREDLTLTTDINKLDWKTRSDYAVNQLRTGDQKTALAILEDLYRSHPTEYNIIANLGTAYELTGNKTKALEFLRKAVAINPRSHYESEWIHIRLLEQEISGTPDYKKIINLGVGSFPEWLIDKTYKFPRNADSLKLQIAFQLHERIGFIAPPNKAIGQLVTDFADIVAKTDSLGAAKEFYQFALSYDSTLKDTVAARIRGVESSQKEVKDTFRWATVVWAIPLVALLMIFFAWLKSMRNQKKNS